MKTLMLGAALALATTPAMAEDLCSGLAIYAKSAMNAHQSGMPLGEVLDNLDDGKDEALRQAMELIVLEAYGYPRYHTPDNQLRTAAEYRDRVHVECLRAIQ